MATRSDNPCENFEMADKICRSMYERNVPNTFEELTALVRCWEAVCLHLCGIEELSLLSYTAAGWEAFILPYEDSEYVSFFVSSASVHGSGSGKLAASLARMVGDCLKLGGFEHEKDEDGELFVFRK